MLRRCRAVALMVTVSAIFMTLCVDKVVCADEDYDFMDLYPDAAKLLYKVEATDNKAFYGQLNRLAQKTGLIDYKEKFLANNPPKSLMNYVNLALSQEKYDAFYELGMLFYEGNTVKKDFVEAYKYFNLAAERQQRDAQFRCGIMRYKGETSAKDLYEAAVWFGRAANNGEQNAQYYFGYMNYHGEGLKKDEIAAAKWYRKAAEQGHMLAQKDLGLMYFNGVGVQKDTVEAAKWIRKAAAQGCPQAQYSMGLMYSSGIGVPVDLPEALTWYEKAAGQGVDDARKRMVLLQAIRADKGDAETQYSIGMAYSAGEDIAQSDSEAISWMKKAANQGLPKAQFQLGLMLKGQKGNRNNYDKANEWIGKAAKNGSIEAKDYIKNEEIERKNVKIGNYMKYTLQPMCNTIGEAEACGFNTEESRNIVMAEFKKADKDIHSSSSASAGYIVQIKACEFGIDLSYKVQLAKNKDCKIIKSSLKDILGMASSTNEKSKKVKTKQAKQSQ